LENNSPRRQPYQRWFLIAIPQFASTIGS